MDSDKTFQLEQSKGSEGNMVHARTFESFLMGHA